MLKLEWGGKEECLLEHTTPTDKQFIINKDKSVNFDTTNNIIIEGDNLDVLKLLQSEYCKKIKMIYIDPPYNTGKKGLYRDKYWQARECKHSNWLSMMYPRLKLARELLRDDGVIFVSIDDNEQANLKLLMDEIFGEGNFVSNIVHNNKYTISNDSKWISKQYEFIIISAKNKDKLSINLLPRTITMNLAYTNPDNDHRGAWKATPLHAKSGTENSKYEITFKNGIIWKAPNGRYSRYSKKRLKILDEENRITFGKDLRSTPSVKTFLSEVKDGKGIGNFWSYDDVGSSHQANERISQLLGKGIFDNPKPESLLKRIIQISTNNNDIILDFFAGSGTTGHAVMQLNMEEKKQAIENGEDPELVGNRKYIMVQLPEQIDEKTDAYKAGYKKISDITIERIKRARKNIKEDSDNIDIEIDLGFKVFELAHKQLF